MNQNQPKKNPLSSFYRQPKIYVRLPSKGKFYEPGSLDLSENGEYPVYAMTAKDELLFKTPDALLNGTSTVELIKSCIPAILNPWVMPNIDLDFALIAIRIATYGDKMDVGTNCPHCDAENSYDMDLTAWLDIFNNFIYNTDIAVDPLTVHVRPYTYKEVTKTALKSMEQQRIFQVINDDTLSDEIKLEKFGASFLKLTELTVDVIADCITAIDTPDGSVSDKAMIKEFIANCSKDIFQKIQDHVVQMKELIEFKAQNVTCGECSKPFSLPVTMDQSNFFAVKS
jgi:bacterioferritin-associated ferredoxin